MSHSRSSRLLALSVLIPLLSACKTHADTEDTSPPEVELRYRFDDGEWELLGAGASIEFVGDELHLWAVAEDSGGVEEVWIEGVGHPTCAYPSGTRYESEVSVEASHSEDAGVEEGDSTEAIRNVTLDFPARKACDQGLSHEYLSGEIEFVAKARNFAGLVASSGRLEVYRD